MSYCTPADVRLVLDPFTTDATQPSDGRTNAASLSEVQIQADIDAADERIDGYLNARYTTPVGLDETTGNIPAVVKNLSRDIAQYFVTLDFRKNKDFTDQDPVARRYHDAMAFLRAVSNGSAAISLPTQGGDSATGEAGTPFNQYPGQMFSLQDFRLYPGVEYAERARWS